MNGKMPANNIYPRDLSWRYFLEDEYGKPYFKELLNHIWQARQKGKNIFPHEYNVFNALNHTSVWDTKVVIIGQDPYPSLDRATGLAFSVPFWTDKKDFPPSLKNIFRALKIDLGIENEVGALDKWAEQGVLLLNRILTVEEGKPMSHAGIGWEQFTEAVIDALLKKPQPIIWCLWGKEAQKLKSKIIAKGGSRGDEILETSHPSPLSVHRGFLFAKHFSKINDFCVRNNYETINWSTGK